MTEDKSKSLTIPQNNSLARVEKSIAITNKLLSTIDDTVTDIDGNVYKTVRIGDQIWMTENLKVTHYRNGDLIPTGYNDEEWANLNVGAYCFYNDDPKNIDIYGNLYNEYTVEDRRGIAPKGWHVPSAEEWIKLVELNCPNESKAPQWREIHTCYYGGKLKEVGDVHWKPSELTKSNADNESSFTALPGGFRDEVGGYNALGEVGLFLTRSIIDDMRWVLQIFNVSEISLFEVSFTNEPYGCAWSVRCLKD